MTVLDLDLDFFLNDIENNRPIFSEERLNDAEYHPWGEDNFRRFLEERCGLSREKKILGRVIRHHHQAFHFWRELVGQGRLATPFRIVHGDAHADLGQPARGWDYLMGRVLHRPPAKRGRIKTGQDHLNPGNYLIFAVGAEWVQEIIFVTHPLWDGRDLPGLYFQNLDPKTKILHLRKYNPIDIDKFARSTGSLAEYPFDLVGHAVPLAIIPGEEFRWEEKFDVALLCQSPGFTPKSADQLIPVFREYIQEDKGRSKVKRTS